MRWIRLLSALLKAKLKSKVDASDTFCISFRVCITDIDVSIMNHSAILTVMETGRLDLMVRFNFFKIAAKNNWFFLSKKVNNAFIVLGGAITGYFLILI